MSHPRYLIALALALALGGQTDKHMGLGRIVHAVIELGHITWAAGQVANQLAKTFEAAALFWDGDRKQSLALFAHFGALGDKT